MERNGIKVQEPLMDQGREGSQLTSDGGAECEERRDELSKTED